MKRFLLLIAPIILGLLAFSVFLFFYSKSQSGNGALQITSHPQSMVYMNGKPIGKTPLCKCEGKDMILSGVYSLKLVPIVGNNLSPYEDTITITKDVLTVVDRSFGAGEFSTGSIITLVPQSNKNTAQLFVLSFPQSANVSLDGNTAGTTPLLLQSVTDSDHDLLLTKPGYEDETVHVHAVSGYQLKAIITLGQINQDGTSSAALQVSPAVGSGPTPTPLQKTTITILDTPTGFLRVRSEPSLAASETAQAKPGDTYPYVDEQDGWYEIQLSTSQTGWVSTQYAQKK